MDMSDLPVVVSKKAPSVREHDRPVAIPVDVMGGVSAVGQARWTLRGDCVSEQRVASDMASLGTSLKLLFGHRLRLAIVVGGFARGEGGMTSSGGELVPHNDYDLMVLIDPVLAGDARRCSNFEAQWSERLGVHVEIARVSHEVMASPPPTLFWLDVSLGGARVIAGDPAILQASRAVTPRRVPMDEAGRLLANRAVGLALSNLEGPESTNEVKVRHLHKAALACGDALLLTVDRYAPTLEQRLEALMMLGEAPSVGAWLIDAYADAITYRLDTAAWRPEGGDIDAWFHRLLPQIAERHLAFESWRSGAPSKLAEFVGWEGELFSDRGDARLGPALAAARAYATGAAPLRPYVGHPRERLARVAAGIAYDRDPSGEARRAALNLLGVEASADDRAVRSALTRLRSVGS